MTARRIHFEKWEGLGNDFVLVDSTVSIGPAEARTLCDRRFGIGADGILVVDRRGPVPSMIVWNADGSRPEMCGNGLRCVAKLVHDHGIAPKSRLKIETGRGVLTADLEIENGKARRVTIDMGAPILQSSDIPTTLPGDPPVLAPLDVAGTVLSVTCVSMGNPHCITFVDALTDELVLGVGPKVEKHSAFPRRVNAEFVVVNRRDDATMRVWERGSGETLACGTGACAVAVAGVLADKLDRRVTIHLLGGDLELHWSESDSHVYMTGPAAEVFHGEWPD